MKRIVSAALAGAMCLSLAACGSTAAPAASESEVGSTPAVTQPLSTETEAAATPKYVFLFIGDGMSYPQFQAASDYLGAQADSDYLDALSDDTGTAVLDGNKALNFMNFAASGSAVTYDSTSFCPDSASTATSISTGNKTYSGTINMDETGTVAYETIAEKVHDQLGYQVGVISTVNLNHATPAAFYAHQASRNSYYEIGLELIDSNFEYFAGGGLKKTTGNDKDKTDLYELAQQAGYTVTFTNEEAQAITADDSKVILIDEQLADSDSMSYELDRTEDQWSLADYVSKGIEVLDNDTGFFMMCEGGKIDWACHANDAASTVNDTLAFADAVQVAVDFAKEHADETLIIVTGDHETGGLTIGYAGTDYDTFLTNLDAQQISYAQFDEQYVEGYKTNGTSFEDAMKDVETLFGLKLTGDAESDMMVLTQQETERLQAAYELSMTDYDASTYTQNEYVMYGGYNPFSVTITHILNNKAGVDFTSFSHTGLPVAVFADGVGADDFNGYYDNTDIFNKVSTLLDVQ